MKSALITYVAEIEDKKINDLKRTSKYNKVYVLTLKNNATAQFLKKIKNIFIIECKSRKEIPSQIKTIYKNEDSNVLILPYFPGDSNSKFAISIYNKTFSTKIDPKVFRHKNEMNKFLGKEICNKKNLKLNYNQVKEKTYAEISEEIGENFILKPINAASSLLNFKIK